MSTLASMPTQPAAPIRIPWPLYRMTVEQYESLIATGFFAEQDDVHLINGYVVNRMAESPEHGTVCDVIRMDHGGDPAGRGRLACPRPERAEDPLAGQHPAPRPRRRPR